MIEGVWQAVQATGLPYRPHAGAHGPETVPLFRLRQRVPTGARSRLPHADAHQGAALHVHDMRQDHVNAVSSGAAHENAHRGEAVPV